MARSLSIFVALAGILAGVAVFALGGSRPAGDVPGPDQRAAVERIGADLDGKLRESAAALGARAGTLAELPRLQAAVATDSATVRDLTQEELMFRPKAGETIEIAQVATAGTITSLWKTAAGASPAPPLDKEGFHLQVVDGTLYLSDVVRVVPRVRGDELRGAIALSWPVDVRAAGQALAQIKAAGELRTDGGALALGLGSAGTSPVEIAVPLRSDPGAGAKLVVYVAAPAAASNTATRGAMGGLLALIGLVGGAILWRKKPVDDAAGGPTPDRASGSTRSTGVAVAGAPPAGGPGTNANTNVAGTGAADSSQSAAVGGSPQQIGRYTIVKALGSGGMADVYLARSTGEAGFEKLIALKVMQSHLARQPMIVEHFLDEARLASRLVHPNIVQIFDLGRAGDEYYIAMEYVDGSDLERLLELCRQNHRTVPLRVAFTIIRKVCDGLDAAHTATAVDGSPLELVHRDVKAANVFVARTGAVKVGDFGIAKANQASRGAKTELGQAKGTAAFMAPEHRIGNPVDRRADVYAVGAVAYELFTGEGVNLDLVRIGHLGKEGWPHLRRPSEVRPELPPELDELIFKALAFEKEDRFDSCAAFEEQLDVIATRHGLVAADKVVAQWVASELDGAAPPSDPSVSGRTTPR